MKNFIDLIKSKEQKITASYIGKELRSFEKISADLDTKHHQILDDLNEVNHLLTLVANHKIEVKKEVKLLKQPKKGWILDIQHKLENLHLKKTNLLTSDDITFLEQETSKLLFEKERLEKEHKELHGVLAKNMVLLMDVRNTVAKEITGGYDVAQVAEKLLEKFSKTVEDAYYYEEGCTTILNFLEVEFFISKVHAKTLFDVLKNSKAIKYISDDENFDASYYNGVFDFSTNYVYVPVKGKWSINS